MQLHRLQPMCKKTPLSTNHKNSPRILMIGGFTLFENNCHRLGVITVFVQWLLHALSCWLWMMKQTVTCIWQGLSCKIPLNLSGCHVKYSRLDVGSFFAGNLPSLHVAYVSQWMLFPYEHLKYFSRAMSVYLVSSSSVHVPYKWKSILYVKFTDVCCRTVPMPNENFMSATLCVAWLETLTRDMPPFLLVQGNRTFVLTVCSWAFGLYIVPFNGICYWAWILYHSSGVWVFSVIMTKNIRSFGACYYTWRHAS